MWNIEIDEIIPVTFSSFEKNVYAMHNDLSRETDALVGLEVSFKEMFDEQNGMRQDVPNALFYMTGKKCSQEEDQICPKSEFPWHPHI